MHTKGEHMTTVKNIEDFLAANQLYTGRYDRLWKELEMHRVAEQADRIGVERDGCRMSQARISEVWTWLNRSHKAGTLRHWA
jgi:hypothetical protein